MTTPPFTMYTGTQFWRGGRLDGPTTVYAVSQTPVPYHVCDWSSNWPRGVDAAVYQQTNGQPKLWLVDQESRDDYPT